MGSGEKSGAMGQPPRMLIAGEAQRKHGTDADKKKKKTQKWRCLVELWTPSEPHPHFGDKPLELESKHVLLYSVVSLYSTRECIMVPLLPFRYSIGSKY